MSPTSAVLWHRNLVRMSEMASDKGGPEYKQLFNDGPPFFRAEEASYTTLTLVFACPDVPLDGVVGSELLHLLLLQLPQPSQLYPPSSVPG